MRYYYYNCPRGFSNEFDIISVDTSNEKELALLEKLQTAYNNSSNTDWDLHRVTAKRAREIVAAERATKRSYERAGLNLTQNPVGATEIITITDFYSYR